MLDKRFFFELGALVGAAALCATVSNAMSSTDRRVAWVGSYDRPAKRSERSVPPRPVTTAPATTSASAAITPAPATPVLPLQSDVPPVAPATTTAPAAVTPAVTATPSTVAPQTPVVAAPATPAPPAVAKTFPSHPDKPFVEVSGEDVALLHGRKVPFFDARRTSVYEEGHIAGARNISPWESDVDQKVRAVFDENLDPDTPIVVYCNGGQCEDSHMLAEKLWGIGLNNVLVYKDGYPDWLARGGAVVKGGAR